MTQSSGRLAAVLLLILSLIWSILPIDSPLSAVNENRWMPVNMPAEGAAGRWVLASGSDARHLTITTDGTLYCYVNTPASLNTLFKSTDSGHSWQPSGQVTDTIVDITALPQNPSIYYATISGVYKSVDAGNTFTPVSSIPGGAGIDNIRITSLDVTQINGGSIVAVSTADSDSAQYGGVYLLDESQPGGIWTDTGIGSFDVYRVVFSPNYSNDSHLIALASDEVNTYISSRVGDGNWGETIGNACIPGIVPAAAAIAFPGNYSGPADNSVLLAGIDTGTGNGDVYMITCVSAPFMSAVTDLNTGLIDGAAGTDITSLAISGNTILAGCARDARLYLSNDSGASWTQCAKPPTGQTDTCVMMSPGFAYDRKAYAVTCGQESAVSCSIDGGISWNQTGLIDSKISTITDLATPAASAVFMITYNAESLKHSLWRTSDGGNLWERIFCGSFTGINSLSMVKTVPGYSYFTPTVLVAGLKDGNPAIWKSNDNGQTFSVSTVPFSIDAWGIADANTWFIGSFDGTNGQVYRTTSGGNSYEVVASAGSHLLTALALSPNYESDRTILAGNITGEIYISDNDGIDYRLLGQQLPLSAGIGNINLAFDSRFSISRIIYATTDAKVTPDSKDRLFRFILGQSITWESICNNLPENAILKQVSVSDDGTLYAVNTQMAVFADKKGGMLRSVNSNYPAPLFEVVLDGIEETVVLKKLSVSGNQVWTIDTKNIRLMTFVDSLTSQVTLYSPVNKSQAQNPSDLNLQWLPLPGAIAYEWAVSDNPDFFNISAGHSGMTSSCSVQPTKLSPGAKYYWHVRAVQPLMSKWSDAWTFTVSLTGVPQLTKPEAGTITSLEPDFRWSTVTGATKYDFQMAEDTLFKNIVIDKTGENACLSNTWKCDISLKNDTIYYWRVKARSAESSSNWSTVSAFTTEPVPLAVTTPELEPTTEATTTIEPTTSQTQSPKETITAPSIVQTTPTNNAVSIPIWALYSIVGLLAVIVFTLIVLLIIVVKQRH